MTRTTKVEPPGCPAQLRAICCDTLGLVKVVQSRVENGAECGPLDVVARWGQLGFGLGITAMSYSTGLKNKLAVARKSGLIEVLDSANGAVCAQVAAPAVEKERGDEEICGVHLFKDNSSWENRILSCRQNGNALVQSFNDTETEVVTKWDVCKSGKILSMKVHNNEKFAAVGGEGVELNIWDLESSFKVWEAKKPKRNKIGLTAPAFVTASAFVSKDDHRKIVIGTGDYQVRLYDVQAQRRPVIAVDYGESPIRAVAEDPDGYTVYVGNSAGNMASFDMRTGKLVAGFKGKLAGSVRCIARHSVLPVIASCGLDRFLRVHDVSSKQLLGKIFLKQPLIGLVFDNVTTKETNDEALMDKASIEQYEDLSEHEEDKKKLTSKRKHSDDENEYPEEEYSSESPKKKKKVVTSKRRHEDCEVQHEDIEVPKKKKKKKVESKRKHGEGSNIEYEEHNNLQVPKKKKVKSKQKHEDDHNGGDEEKCKERPKKKKVTPKEKHEEDGETHNSEHEEQNDVKVPAKKKVKSKIRDIHKKKVVKSKRKKQAGNEEVDEESPKKKIKQKNR